MNGVNSLLIPIDCQLMKDSFYKDHWTSIEPERFERYKEMFEWSEDSRPLLEPANIRTGERVVEIGCGPGFTVCEIASWVSPSGYVDGIDINAFGFCFFALCDKIDGSLIEWFIPSDINHF